VHTQHTTSPTLLPAPPDPFGNHALRQPLLAVLLAFNLLPDNAFCVKHMLVPPPHTHTHSLTPLSQSLTHSLTHPYTHTPTEPEAVDLLLEVEQLDQLEGYVDDKNFARTCLYLTSCCSYLPEPEDTQVCLWRWGWGGFATWCWQCGNVG
jgi:hypothetical protein